MSLAGRTYAIAGAGGALGPHVAWALLAAGANVALADRDQELLEGVVGTLPSDRVRSDAVDLLDPAESVRWCEAVTRRFGAVDGLLHLVGGWRGGTPLAEAPDDDWLVMHDLAIRTTQHTSRAFREQLAAAGPRGRFLLVSSLQAQAPGGRSAAYAAAKAAAETWTLALADDLKGTGATANVVVVNALVTPEQKEASPEKAFKTFQDVRDVAATLTFLCTDPARTMSGQRVVLAGAH
ncbi:MAG: family oxidoreductase [Solirubrobacterales bacterium]|jgi:NAD(P)-dependent dehydrogenase (short-subunit alcohol dehydrogenase family)|nr:family oxidoreductase [Solirubrobacterales bacterium]